MPEDTFPTAPLRLYSGAPFWLVKHGIPEDGQPLDDDARCDVAIIGAGITGAFLADTLCAQGHEVIVLDRQAPATGSTGASTAIVMYDLDVDLTSLMRDLGEPDAIRVYRASQQAAIALTQTAISLGGCGVAMRDSLYLGTRGRAADRLRREAEARQRVGLPAQFLDAPAVEAQFGLASEGALLSSGAAQVDPVRLTLALLQRAVRRGARLASHTSVTNVSTEARGFVLRTSRGSTVRARRIVYATGYEMPPSVGTDLVLMHSTYALATERMRAVPEWLERTVVWETSRPYAYVRTSGDGRILVGGEDLRYRSASLRDRLLPERIARLERRLARFVPGHHPRTAFAWAGTFAETKDCLPLIGPHPRQPGAYVALAYGGNGMNYAVLAARIIADDLAGRQNDLARLVAPDRDVTRGSQSCGARGATGTFTHTTGVRT